MILKKRMNIHTASFAVISYQFALTLQISGAFTRTLNLFCWAFGFSLLRVILLVEVARPILCILLSVCFVDGHFSDTDIATLLNLFGNGD